MACGSTTEGHVSKKNNKRSISLFVLERNDYFVIIFLISIEILIFLIFEKLWPSFDQMFGLNLLRGLQNFSI